jgi:hypothetical protein
MYIIIIIIIIIMFSYWCNKLVPLRECYVLPLEGQTYECYVEKRLLFILRITRNTWKHYVEKCEVLTV